MESFLPPHIHLYLNSRGIPDDIIDVNKITWDGTRIVIPIFDQSGAWMFNKYRRDPESGDGVKYSYDKGATAALYGANKLSLSETIVVCEGELDSLVLEANGFYAVSTTGGTGTFKEEWIPLLANKDIYICYDNDKPGLEGMVRVTKMMPSIKAIFLPKDVGDHGDVTDFFTKLKKTAAQFKKLMDAAKPLELPPEPKPKKRSMRRVADQGRLEAAKAVPLEQFLKFNSRHFAHCPFHNEKTPSFHRFGQNRWKCFGCGEHGDVVDFVMKRFDLNLAGAIDYLLNQ